MTEQVVEQGTDTGGKDEATLLRQSYDMATQRLREAHTDEFKKLRQAAAQELGIEWTPRLTPEERAERDFDKLLGEFPHLASRVQRVEQ